MKTNLVHQALVISAVGAIGALTVILDPDMQPKMLLAGFFIAAIVVCIAMAFAIEHKKGVAV